MGVLGWEFAVLLGSIWLTSIFSIYAHIYSSKIAAEAISERISLLDEALGDAIESLVGSGIVANPPNPLIGLLTSVIQDSIQKKPIEAVITERSKDGKFRKAEPLQ